MNIVDSNGLPVAHEDYVFIQSGLRRPFQGVFTRDAFLTVVQRELHVRLVPDDAIVIDKADLPEVLVGTTGDARVAASAFSGTVRAQSHETYDSLMADARALIAMAEYRKTHPSVDEAQVDALSNILHNVGDGGIFEHLDRANSDVLAHTLIATGKVTVVTE